MPASVGPASSALNAAGADLVVPCAPDDIKVTWRDEDLDRVAALVVLRAVHGLHPNLAAAARNPDALVDHLKATRDPVAACACVHMGVRMAMHPIVVMASIERKVEAEAHVLPSAVLAEREAEPALGVGGGGEGEREDARDRGDE